MWKSDKIPTISIFFFYHNVVKVIVFEFLKSLIVWQRIQTTVLNYYKSVILLKYTIGQSCSHWLSNDSSN